MMLFFLLQKLLNKHPELEGALVRIIAYSLLEEKNITLDMAKNVLKDLCVNLKTRIN